MFEIGWSEMLIVAAVALIFVSPKDLPILLRTIGRYAGAAKRQLGDVRAQLDSVVQALDVEQTRRELEKVAAPNPSQAAAQRGAAFENAVHAAEAERITLQPRRNAGA